MDKLDILDRDGFISQLLKVIENIADNGSSTCFAINGTWGCGKSFVLDILQEQLEQIQSEKTYTDKYLVIRYNCWKYDYYEEPLVAIVSSIMSFIEEKTKLFPDSEKKRKMLGRFKAVGASLLSVGADAVKAKTGLDIQKAYATMQEGGAKGAASYESDHKYDDYFDFNKILSELSSLLRELSQQYTVVYLVDELDRCLPEYSIKILERLHHLMEGQSNIISIIAIDKNQLLSSVQKTFGFENPQKYLEKFINFEVKLDNGTVTKTISQKYADYISLFDKNIFLFEEPFEECLQAIFSNIEIRMQEQIVNKARLAHQLLYSELKDYTFMCMEVLLAVLICVYQDNSCFSDESVNFEKFEHIFTCGRRRIDPAFNDFFKKQFEEIRFTGGHNFPDEPAAYVLPEKPSLYGAILFTWYWMHKKDTRVVIQYIRGSAYEVIAKNYTELMKFAEMIKLMS